MMKSKPNDPRAQSDNSKISVSRAKPKQRMKDLGRTKKKKKSNQDWECEK